MPKYLVRRAVRELAFGPEWRTGVLRAEVQGYLAGLRLWRLAVGGRR
jgi:hypothetical protein